MLLYPNLIDSVIIDGIEYKVNTKYYIILKVLEYSNNPDFSDAQKVVYCLKLFYKDNWGNDLSKAIDAMWKFITLANYQTKYEDDEKQDKILDYQKDSQIIWASMTQAYGNAWKDWHWYEWKAAFDNLPPESPINKVMGYRLEKITSDMSADEKKRINKLKEIYSLDDEPKKKRTSAQILADLREIKRKRAK